MKDTHKSAIGCLGWLAVVAFFLLSTVLGPFPLKVAAFLVIIFWAIVDQKWLGQAKWIAKRKEEEARSKM